jgi:phenylalanyl-tRNA synthetase beta chain
LPGLERAVETNWSRQVRDVRLFEIGTVFRSSETGGRPFETLRVAGILTGARAPAHWTTGGTVEDLDRWDLKSVFEAALALANPAAEVQVERGGWVARLGEDLIGRAGPLDLQTPAWAAPTFGFELDLNPEGRVPVRYQPLATTPAAWRDVNLVVALDLSVAAAARVIRRAAGSLLESVEVVSDFRSEQLGADRRAVQFRLRFRAADRTVRDEEVDQAVGRVLKAVEKELDARLRTS